MTDLIQYPIGNATSVYTIPNGITNIDDDAFAGCTYLSLVTIPNSVLNIGDDAFCQCTALTFVIIPSSVTSIGFSSFEGCSALKTVAVPSSVQSIGYGAFDSCDNNLLLYVDSDSYAQFYADNSGISYDDMSQLPPIITIDPYTTTPTNKSITVTASANEGTLNAASHTFTKNGSYKFVATDSSGNKTTVIITISNIDKTAPVVSGVTNNSTYTSSVTITFNEGTATLNGAAFTSGGTVSAAKSYTLVVTDAAGNVTTVKFIIKAST